LSRSCASTALPCSNLSRKGNIIFKELGILTISNGGHLSCHITKLIEYGLVIKTDGGKRYSITDRDLGVMDLVKV